MNELEKKEYNKKYSELNKEKLKLYKKEWIKNNKDKIEGHRKKHIENNKEYYKEYYKENKQKINKYYKKYQKQKRELNPLFKLRVNIGNLIRLSITKKGFKKQSKTFKILGCSYEEFKQHIERQFKKGMTWENQVEWHLDHIYPVSLAKDENELLKLNHYTNFQPMWAIENIIKGNKIIENTQIKLI